MSKLKIEENKLTIVCDCGAVHFVTKEGEEIKLNSEFNQQEKDEIENEKRRKAPKQKGFFETITGIKSKE